MDRLTWYRSAGTGIGVHKASVMACLLTHGSGSRPAKEVRTLLELTRYRTTLLQERAAEINRLADRRGPGVGGGDGPAALPDCQPLIS